MVLRGTPPLIGKIWLLAFENGRLLASELATMPVTTLPEGLDPPRMSCMKKDSAGSPPSGAVTGLVAGVVIGGAVVAPPFRGVVTGVAAGVVTGLVAGGVVVVVVAAPPVREFVTGVVTGSGAKGSVGMMGATLAAGIWPLGSVAVGVTAGAATLGSSTSGGTTGSDASKESGGRGTGVVTTSSRSLAEVASVVASSNKQKILRSIK